jgi:hypothetical protein
LETPGVFGFTGALAAGFATEDLAAGDFAAGLTLFGGVDFAAAADLASTCPAFEAPLATVMRSPVLWPTVSVTGPAR